MQEYYKVVNILNFKKCIQMNKAEVEFNSKDSKPNVIMEICIV